jgi:hypothetical protein
MHFPKPHFPRIDIKSALLIAGLAIAAWGIVFFTIWALSIAGARLAKAHDWYPIACCHKMDCAPVDKMTVQPDGGIWVTTKHGTSFVPQDMTRRQSQDARPHACIRPGEDGVMRTICFFVPPMG